MTVDPVSGQLYIGDVGWTQWEEVDAAGPDGNLYFIDLNDGQVGRWVFQ